MSHEALGLLGAAGCRSARAAVGGVELQSLLALLESKAPVAAGALRRA